MRKNTHKMKPVERPLQGQLYHVSWGYRNGIVFRCIEVDEVNKVVRLRTPKTKKELPNPVKWADLRHIRKNEIKNPH